MRIRTATLAVAAVATLAGCSSVSTAPDEQALHYEEGPTSAKDFQNCVTPSSRTLDDFGDKHFVYPAGQRTYSFTGRKGAESDAVSVKTADSQELAVPGFVTFELTEDCDKLRIFHEQIGAKYRAYEAQGWSEFLNDYVAVPLNSTMDKAGLRENWRTLYSSSEAQTEFEEYVKENLPAEVKAAVGDDFLTIKAVSIETPVPHEDLLSGLRAKEKAVLDNEAQKERNETAATKYDGYRDCLAVLSESACVMLNLAESGDIPFYPIPQGSGFTLPAQPQEK